MNFARLLLVGFTIFSTQSIFVSSLCPSGKAELVESIPLGITDGYSNHSSTVDAWLKLIDSAKHTIDLGQYYFSLTDGNSLPTKYGGYMGMKIFQALITANQQRGVKIRIVQNKPDANFPDDDTRTLAQKGIAEVRSIDWTSLIGDGILHTKMILVDGKHAYIGSANTDWRSLAQVKEMGMIVYDCEDIVQDTEKLFEIYWTAAQYTHLPSPFPPSSLDTQYNLKTPAVVSLNGEQVSLFIASSPTQMCTSKRTGDIKALLTAIDRANKYIDVEVMDYAAASLYEKNNFYWPLISDSLVKAAYNRKVNVRLLFSLWRYTNNDTLQWMHALNSIKGIEVKFFVVPDQDINNVVPYTRVNHAKFMVTDNTAYIGTSNWSADYFLNTGGLSWNIIGSSNDSDSGEGLRSQLKSVFERDWNSIYTTPFSI